MTKQIEHQGTEYQEIEYQDKEIPPLEGIIQSPLQMQRLFKTRNAALNFAKFIREGDILIRGGMVDGEKVWQLTPHREQ